MPAPTLETFRHFAEIGSALLPDAELNQLVQATNRLCHANPAEDGAILLALMAAGAVCARFSASMQKVVEKIPLPVDHPEGAPPPVPDWVRDVLAGVGMTRKEEPSGPVKDGEDLRQRAAKSNIILLR